MNKISYILSFFATCICLPAFSDECVSVKGTYVQNGSESVIQIKQSGCSEIQLKFGRLDAQGNPVIGNSGYKIYLDGRVSCAFGTCRTGNASEALIKVEMDKSAPVESQAHGICSYQSFIYEKNLEGSLVKSVNSFGCDDSYAGPIQIIYNLLSTP